MPRTVVPDLNYVGLDGISHTLSPPITSIIPREDISSSHNVYNGELLQLVNRYVYDLNVPLQGLPARLTTPRVRNNDLFSQERTIVSAMRRNGIFEDSVTTLLNTCARGRVNQSYNLNSLSQRFLIVYADILGIPIVDFARLLNDRPLPGNCILPQDRILESFDLDFLDFGTREAAMPSDPEPIPENRYDMCKFIINGQKINLGIQQSNDRASSSRYVSFISIRVSSERNTSTRHIARLENCDRHLVLKRLPIGHPTHGFKFVRNPNREGLYVKEID